MQLSNIQIAKILHGMMSVFREGIGETPYPKWEELTVNTHILYDGAVELIKSGRYITPQDIHNYWMEWAKKYKPDHISIIPYDELSETEKKKDQLIVSIIESLI
jgi:hypothetical protein